jgi:Chitin binding Peritrophin-A domain
MQLEEGKAALTKKFVCSVLAATSMDFAFAAGEPDCVALANANPLKIHQNYHPHESDCNLYYQCSRYALVLMNCPEGLHFDRTYNICGRPHEVTC